MTDESRRRDWLAERRTLLTASDCAAVLGVDTFGRTPLSVYISKTEGVEQAETPDMRRGRKLEAVAASEYAEETGRQVIATEPFEILRHPDIPWLGATLDRLTAGGGRYPSPAGVNDLLLSSSLSADTGKVGNAAVPLELKAVGVSQLRQWRDEAPLYVQIQAQIQIACRAAQWGSVGALLAGLGFKWVDLLRDDAFLNAALPRLEEFWVRVQRRQPPEADGNPGTLALLKAAWPVETGETVALGWSELEMADRLEEAKLRLKDAEEAKARAEAALRLRMGSASFGALLDGTYLSLRETHVAGRTQVVAPYTFRTLRRVRKMLRS